MMFLDMSKIENDKLQLTPQIVSLHSIIFSTLDILQSLAEKKGVLLQRKVNVADCSVYADSRRLQQIMVNLGANAVKFTAKDKKVVLKCDMLGQDDESMLVRFVLEDEGIGIKESNRQCILRHLIRADAVQMLFMEERDWVWPFRRSWLI